MIERNENDKYFNVENILFSLFVRDKIKMNYGFVPKVIESIENSELYAVALEIDEDDLEIAKETLYKPYPDDTVKMESDAEGDSLDTLITFSVFKDSYANSEHYESTCDKNIDGEKILAYMYEDYLAWLNLKSKETDIIMGSISHRCSCDDDSNCEDEFQTELGLYEE